MSDSRLGTPNRATPRKGTAIQMRRNVRTRLSRRIVAQGDSGGRWTEKTFTRAAGGYQSDSSELCVGFTTARPSPAPRRARTRAATDGARPVATEKRPQRAAPAVAMRTRFARSHTNDSGTSNRITAIVDTATSD